MADDRPLELELSGGEGTALASFLRAHPWTAPLERAADGQGWQDDDGDEDLPSRRVDLSVELPREAWHPIDGQGELSAIAFVDGVRRVEAGLVAWEGPEPVWALMGACAAGAILCTPGAAQVVAEVKDRALVVGARWLSEGSVTVRVGDSTLRYRLVTAKGKRQEDVHSSLLSLMRGLEAQVATSLTVPEGGVLALDGLLSFHPHETTGGRPAVGVIKRHRRLYLDGGALECLWQLQPGQRTPIFLMETEKPPTRRYSWYQRVASAGPAADPLAGVLRLETWADLGPEAAGRLADALAASLCRFAADEGRGPRAPANLLPVMALEKHLRRSLGEARWVRRQVRAALATGSL